MPAGISLRQDYFALRVDAIIGQNKQMNSLLRTPKPRNLFVFLCLTALLQGLAQAQDASSPLYTALNNFLRTQTQGLPGKVSFRISPLNARTQLPPCDAFEPFIPSGSKLWGKATVGVRCLGPSNWTIYTQVQISVTGNYLVAARSMAAGQVVGATDIVTRSGDLSTLPSTILTDQAQAVGKTVKLGFANGQPLRSDQLIAPWAIQQGQNVKTVYEGDGFNVSGEGKALNNAIEGQVVQVRTSSGQTISGIARLGGLVEVSH